MHDLGRFARSGYVIIPAARAGSILAEHEDAGRKRIAGAKVVEEPAVQLGFAQGCLNGGDALGRGWVCAHAGRWHEGEERRENEERLLFHERTTISPPGPGLTSQTPFQAGANSATSG